MHNNLLRFDRDFLLFFVGFVKLTQHSDQHGVAVRLEHVVNAMRRRNNPFFVYEGSPAKDYVVWSTL